MNCKGAIHELHQELENLRYQNEGLENKVLDLQNKNREISNQRMNSFKIFISRSLLIK